MPWPRPIAVITQTAPTMTKDELYTPFTRAARVRYTDVHTPLEEYVLEVVHVDSICMCVYFHGHS